MPIVLERESLGNQTVRVEKIQPCFALHLLDSAKQWCLGLYVRVVNGG